MVFDILPIGDKAEVGAIKRFLSCSQSTPWLTSNKGSIGHLLGAAGGVESIFSILAIRDNVIPPSINIEELDKDLAEGVKIAIDEKVTPDEQENVPDNVPKKIVIKNSFGFGGTNVSLVFGEHSPD